MPLAHWTDNSIWWPGHWYSSRLGVISKTFPLVFQDDLLTIGRHCSKENLSAEQVCRQERHKLNRTPKRNAAIETKGFWVELT